MKSYKDYINDPFFMKWIFQSDKKTNSYWESYTEDNPEEKEQLFSVKKELEKLKLKNKTLSTYEKRILYQKILGKTQQNSLVVKIKHNSHKLLAYAAIAFLFLLLGNGLMYLYINKKPDNDLLKYSALEFISLDNTPKFIFSDGSSIPLKKNSSIRYSGKKIIVDNKSFAIPQNDLSKSGFNQLIVPNGNKSQITLNDGSTIILNAGSKLIYPSAFQKGKREVALIGEAFFKVSGNKQKPFVVKTSYYDVKVLGTKFNISAYSDEKQIETVLVEGKVSITGNNKNSFEKEILLRPNQKLSYNKDSKKLNIQKVDVEYDILWPSGMLKFKDKELDQIIKEVERLYDVSIIIRDLEKGKMLISGKLDLSEHEDDIFKYLSVLTKMNFEKINTNHYVMK